MITTKPVCRMSAPTKHKTRSEQATRISKQPPPEITMHSIIFPTTLIVSATLLLISASCLARAQLTGNLPPPLKLNHLIQQTKPTQQISGGSSDDATNELAPIGRSSASASSSMMVMNNITSAATTGAPAINQDCPNGLLTFELSTGFIYKPASSETLAMLPSTLQLTDCLNSCLQNGSCSAINFEMGLCVLLSSSAQQNPTSLYSSQFPVFTIYAEKKCLLSSASTPGKCSPSLASPPLPFPTSLKQKSRC